MIAFFVFIFGASIGSFLNVCISRMPNDESVVQPPSHCPQCRKKIKWSDNIPILSFLILRGKCRYCSSKIPLRYYVTELTVGLIWLTVWLFYGYSGFFFCGIALLSILWAVTVTDLETGLIPDKLTLPGMLIGLLLSSSISCRSESIGLVYGAS